MRRFFSLVVLLLCSIPFGVSISGCSHNVAPVFCNGGDSGPTTDQPTTITLTPIVYGVSLNFAEIGQVGTPSVTNCKGTGVSVAAYTYGTSDMTIADVQPNTGRLCGGTWNRNTGGGIPDYTFCTPTNKTGTAYVSASAEGVTSNPLPIFIHPVVTSIVLGGPSSNCTTDPTTACCPLATVGVVTAPPYQANSCISQGTTAQLVARVFAGTGASRTNISCQAGHLQFTAQGATSLTALSSVVSVDQNGVATANQPGSVLITANVADAASSAGFFSTCPPTSITLSSAGTTTNPVQVNLNNTQPLIATAKDANGVTLTGLQLEYVSTAPTTIAAAEGGTVTPHLSGAASITAVCQPPTCNPSQYNQIGLFGNGKPVTSNSVNIVTPGTNSTVLYMASTQSTEVVQVDFTTSVVGSPFQLPFVPNSMVISNDGSTIYLGSSSALMVLSSANVLSLVRNDNSSPGTVLAVSPDGGTVVISDPVKGTTTLETSSGGVISSFGGVGTHAEFAPDSQSVYVTAGNQLLVYSDFTGWTSITPATSGGTPVTDVAITVPAAGAYFAGPMTTARGYCSASTPASSGANTETNVFYPPADSSPAITDRIAATNDGAHILGATVTPVATLSDLHVTIPTGACPAVGGLTFTNTLATTILSPIIATSITGVDPASDSSVAFVTYTGSSGLLPAYQPIASGPGPTTYIKLSGTATAPVAGVLSADNQTFYVGTSGDNLVHLITRSTLTDGSTIAPNLAGSGGTLVPVNLLVQKPRRTT
jgi:trimeric autotransporter adhesin